MCIVWCYTLRHKTFSFAWHHYLTSILQLDEEAFSIALSLAFSLLFSLSLFVRLKFALCLLINDVRTRSFLHITEFQMEKCSCVLWIWCCCCCFSASSFSAIWISRPLPSTEAWLILYCSLCVRLRPFLHWLWLCVCVRYHGCVSDNDVCRALLYYNFTLLFSAVYLHTHIKTRQANVA